eukprot:scaffold1178_cov135-Amphora_coffeaeformis.AAC.3
MSMPQTLAFALLPLRFYSDTSSSSSSSPRRVPPKLFWCVYTTLSPLLLGGGWWGDDVLFSGSKENCHLRSPRSGNVERSLVCVCVPASIHHGRVGGRFFVTVGQ